MRAAELPEAQRGGADAVDDPAGRAERLRDRREDPDAAPEEEDGAGRAGEHTGLSPAMLSKIERGLLFPTLPTLLRVALVFSVGLDFFFAGGRDKPLVAIVRKKDRVALPERPGRATSPTSSSRSTSPRPSGASTPTSRSSSGRRRCDAPAPSSRRRVHLHAARHARRAHERRRASAGGGRFDLLRRQRAPRLSERNGRTCTALVVTAA